MKLNELQEIQRQENLMRVNGRSEQEIIEWRRTNLNAQIMRSNRLQTRINYVVLIALIFVIILAFIIIKDLTTK